MTWTLAVDAVVPGCARIARVASDRPVDASIRPASHRFADVPVRPASHRFAQGLVRPQQPASARRRDVPDVRGSVVTLADWSFDPGRDDV